MIDPDGLWGIYGLDYEGDGPMLEGPYAPDVMLGPATMVQSDPTVDKPGPSGEKNQKLFEKEIKPDVAAQDKTKQSIDPYENTTYLVGDDRTNFERKIDQAITKISVVKNYLTPEPKYHTTPDGTKHRILTGTVPIPGGSSLKKMGQINKITSRITRGGDKAIRIFKKNGTILDISTKRVKMYVPNAHPKAPPGTLNKVKFKNAISGTKGYKRPPTEEELNILKEFIQ